MPRVTVLGIFVADLAFRAGRLPAMGETILGADFRLGPGGKGSNQAIAARRAGAEVSLISRLGADAFGRLARETYRAEGIDDGRVAEDPERGTGAAFILVQEATGENAIIVTMGAAGALTEADVDAAEDAIRGAAVFATNCEVPVPVARRGLELARRHGVATILNPAPAVPLPDEIFPLVDFLTPNESEAAALVGFPVEGAAGAEAAADALRAKGVGTAVITLGAAGALVVSASVRRIVPARPAGPVLDTTGAGDAFNGGFAVALAEGRPPVEAARFGCAVAGISVTRHGTAPSMPSREEVEALLAQGT